LFPEGIIFGSNTKNDLAMILTITMNPAVDKSTSFDKLVPEKKLRCSELVTEAGGGGINVSKAIKKLGGDTLAIFPSGGHNGKIIESHLEKQGIAYQAIPISEETRENFVAVEKSTNAQYRFVMPGPRLSGEELNACFEILDKMKEKPRLIVASGSLPPGADKDFYARLAEKSRQLGIKYIVDTSGEPLKLAAEAGVYLLKPNLTELCSLVGKEHLEMEEVDDAALKIIKQGNCEVIVVSLGPSGALLVSKEGYEHIPSPTVKKRTTVGAGDSMVAGMAVMIDQGRSLQEMVRFGVACGTAATMNSGTQLFKEEDVHHIHHWIEKYGEKYKIDMEN
jgi:6-phosphofructokinase 2